MKRQRILVTGGAGFIGSNLVIKLAQLYPDAEIMNLDKLTYASDLGYLEAVKNHNNYRFKKVDLVDRVSVKEILRKFAPHSVYHLAAESHVDNSIKGPEDFIHSNIVGTFNIIEECRQLWMDKDYDFSDFPTRFLHISTDEVYGSLGKEGEFTEESKYMPNSPYSASKASSDMIVRSYHHTFGMNVVTTHCSNNYGPHQHAEKLIPTIIRKALAGQAIPVYGDGSNVRDWLFVEDHCDALIHCMDKGKAGETYNIGGNNEWTNIELVRLICQILDEELNKEKGSHEALISFVTDRLGHDYRYAIDASKIKKELGWEPTQDFMPLLRKTVNYFMKKFTKAI